MLVFREVRYTRANMQLIQYEDPVQTSADGQFGGSPEPGTGKGTLVVAEVPTGEDPLLV